MRLFKKFNLIFLFCIAFLAGWTAYKISVKTPNEEAQNFFASEIYSAYRGQLREFLIAHSDFDANIPSEGSSVDKKIKLIFDELNKPVESINEKRKSHEKIVSSIRKAIRTNNSDDKSNKLLQDIVKWHYTGAQLNNEIKDYFYSIASNPKKDLLEYLEKAQADLYKNKKFQGREFGTSREDQFKHGNLPYAVSKIGNTQIFRMGQPINTPLHLPFSWSPLEPSPEFIYFIDAQKKHLYVNLMRRNGFEGAFTKTLENIELMHPTLSVVTLDKNSDFYLQKNRHSKNNQEADSFKKEFFEEFFKVNGPYYWSKHLDIESWNQKISGVINGVHQKYFQNSESLNRQERLDFIEISYINILDELVEALNPESMNITCRQGMDRGPSLMILWLYEKQLCDDQETAAYLLAPPILIHNRASHKNKIERFISAAKRLRTK